MDLRVTVGLLTASVCMASVAEAQEITPVLYEGNYSVLGGETVSATASLPEGFAPLNDEVAFVYDPNFHFYMRGYLLDPAYDRREEFRDYGYVLVAAAGDPGGNYQTEPTWLSHEGFAATEADGQVTLSYSYGATYVPTRRGYQSFLIYTNLAQVGAQDSLFVYDDSLTFGRGNYLMTGDGPEQATMLQLQGDGAHSGQHAIHVLTERDTGGTHWKLMLFANGNAAGYDGVDLSGYDKLVFWAKASRDVTLQGGFGTADDSGATGFAPLALTTAYQRFEVDLSALDRSDVNTAFWVYLHKAHNPFSFAGVSVSFDAIELVGAGATQDAVIAVDQGADSASGVCASDGSHTGLCNLRAAVSQAASAGGEVVIRLDAAQSLDLGQVVVPAGTNVQIVAGAERELSNAVGYGRALLVEEGATVTLSGLTVRGFSSQEGGALYNAGHLTLDGVSVRDNSARCSGVGAMTAFATCMGGAIVNRGTLALRGGSELRGNVVLATASTASFTNALAGGGAIVNQGELIIDGPVVFADNSADATAHSGVHPQMPSGASASAFGGAIWHGGGTLSVVGSGVGQCLFEGNSALAAAAGFNVPGTATSQGGAIAAAAPFALPAGACTFRENSADTGADVYAPQ